MLTIPRSFFPVLILTALLTIASASCSSQEQGATTTESQDHPANHLADETSPYLLMHAHNPVDWYPWSSEALALAKEENKPIFLSVGYSSCHWCHVMERESFLDKEIAAFLNEHFVCIKVDREERPDIDNIYMRSLYVYHALAGSRQGGGWPLSVFMTPEGQPFFAGTYFPARDGDRGNSPGFLTLITRIREGWRDSEDAIRQDAKTIAEVTRRELEELRVAEGFVIDETLLSRAMKSFEDQYDPRYGGFGFSDANDRIPKFPEASNLEFLLSVAQEENEASEWPTESTRQSALKMLTTTLDAMARGGIRDHIGGGFHRYSVDRYWRIPHFEKMLYDQGQLASIYAEAFALTGNGEYRLVLEEMLDFVQREMVAPEGAFYSALDAESEGEEGKFYRWERETISELLEDDEFELFSATYGLNNDPNFDGFYALQLVQPKPDLAKKFGIEVVELEQRLKPAEGKLLASRNERSRPLTDTKILAGWNGLMIRGYADAGRILNEERYVEQAERAAEFVWQQMRDADGRLFRTYGNGEARLNAYLSDYAYVVEAFIALHEATDESLWLERAEELSSKQESLFWDEQQGGFFFTSDDHESLLARAKNPADQAEPAGNSVAAANMIILDQYFADRDYEKKVLRSIESVSGVLERSPQICPRLLTTIKTIIGK